MSLVLLIWAVLGGLAAFQYFSENLLLTIGVISGFIGAMGLILLRDAFVDYKKSVNFWEDFLHFDYYRVVWVYYSKLQNMPFGISTNQQCRLYVCLDNREKLMLSMRESEISDAMFWFQRLLPSSSFGYSASKEQLFNIGPDLLVNAK